MKDGDKRKFQVVKEGYEITEVDEYVKKVEGQIKTLLPAMNTIQKLAVWDVICERVRQSIKWGEQNHDWGLWIKILQEEIGEFCKANLEYEFDDPYACGTHREEMREELIQVAAVALAMVECFKRDKWPKGKV